MKLNSFDSSVVFDWAVDLASRQMQDEVSSQIAASETAVDALSAIMAFDEKPEIYTDEESCRFGECVAGKILSGRTLFITARGDDVTAQLDDEHIPYTMLRRLEGIEYFLHEMAEGLFEVDADEHPIPGGAAILVRGERADWRKHLLSREKLELWLRKS